MTSHGFRIAFALIAFVLASPLLLLSGCGSSGAASTPKNVNCGKDGFICDPPGFPFAQTVLAVSDLCDGPIVSCSMGSNPPPASTTAHLTQPTAGQVCMSGTVAPGGWALLAVVFSTASNDGMRIERTFDATKLGITQVAFTMDSPLTGGVGVGAITTPVGPVDCPNASCFTSFDYATFTQPGAEVAPFTDFVPQDGGTEVFDTTALQLVQFVTSGAGDYAFCISDFKFLDAAGNEVKA